MHAEGQSPRLGGYVRFIIGSANLTPAGYREKIEAAGHPRRDHDAVAARPVALAALASIRALVDQTPNDAGEEGPKQRALDTLALARRMIDRFGLPAQRARKDPLLTVNHAQPGGPRLRHSVKSGAAGHHAGQQSSRPSMTLRAPPKSSPNTRIGARETRAGQAAFRPARRHTTGSHSRPGAKGTCGRRTQPVRARVLPACRRSAGAAAASRKGHRSRERRLGGCARRIIELHARRARSTPWQRPP